MKISSLSNTVIFSFSQIGVATRNTHNPRPHIPLVKVSILWYNRYMKKPCRDISSAVSLVIYHFVFCSRYRRKIFQIDGLADRFKELVCQICEQRGIEILTLECGADHCHISVEAPPILSPADIMRLIKNGTGAILVQEYFPTKRGQIWTRGYFVSTDKNVPDTVIKKYIESQRTRGA